MRKRQAKKRPLLPDPRFNDQLVTRFVNMLMWDGKKSVAFKIFYDAIDIVDQRKTDEEKPAIEVWKDALSNVMPHVEVRSRRVGGATFQIPMQIRPDRKISTAMKWLISFARNEMKNQWPKSWLQRSWRHPARKVLRLKGVWTPTRWPRRTKHSLTSDFNFNDGKRFKIY